MTRSYSQHLGLDGLMVQLTTYPSYVEFVQYVCHTLSKGDFIRLCDWLFVVSLPQQLVG